jgi:hypothetical protein
LILRVVVLICVLYFIIVMFLFLFLGVGVVFSILSVFCISGRLVFGFRCVMLFVFGHWR